MDSVKLSGHKSDLVQSVYMCVCLSWSVFDREKELGTKKKKKIENATDTARWEFLYQFDILTLVFKTLCSFKKEHGMLEDT